MRFPWDRKPLEPDVCEQPIIQTQQAAQVVPLSAALLPGTPHGAPVGQERAHDVPDTCGNDTIPVGRHSALRHHAILHGAVVLSALMSPLCQVTPSPGIW